MRWLLPFVGVAVVVVLTGSGSAATSAEVTMPGRFYAPHELDVLVGTTVTWRNTDRGTHTVTEDDDEFDSGHIRPGDSFSQLFAERGTFAFHCTIHRFMRGVVHVFDVVLRGPERPVVAGRRAHLQGVAPSGVAQVVVERVTPGPREIVARVPPSPDGTFSVALRAPEPRRFRARAGTASSPLVLVRVEPRVSAERIGSGVAVHAVPLRAGNPVVLQEYDREHFAWVTVARSRLDARSSATFPYESSVRRHVRAVVPGRRGWGDGASRPIVVGLG